MTTRIDAARTRLLDGATELFLERGFEGTSTDAIIERVGGSKATMYRLFPSKEFLLAAIVARVGAELAREAEGADDTDGASSPREWLGALAHDSLRRALSPEILGLYRLVVARAAQQPELARAFHAAGPAVLHTSLARRLACAHAAGELDCPDAERAAEQFFGLLLDAPLMEALLSVRTALEGPALEAHVAACVEAFLAPRLAHSNAL